MKTPEIDKPVLDEDEDAPLKVVGDMPIGAKFFQQGIEWEVKRRRGDYVIVGVGSGYTKAILKNEKIRKS